MFTDTACSPQLTSRPSRPCSTATTPWHTCSIFAVHRSHKQVERCCGLPSFRCRVFLQTPLLRRTHPLGPETVKSDRRHSQAALGSWPGRSSTPATAQRRSAQTFQLEMECVEAVSGMGERQVFSSAAESEQHLSSGF